MLSKNKIPGNRGVDKKRNSFPTEKELVCAIIRSRGRSWDKKKKNSLGVLSEFESSVGRADVVFYSLKKIGAINCYMARSVHVGYMR